MSNKSKNHNKKWLISRLKTSGSKRRYIIDGDYADERNSKKRKDWYNLPNIEGFGKSSKFYNNKVNYGLLVRFLRGKVGQDWNAVHSEIMDRIPSDLSEYKECVEWFVSDSVEHQELGLWDKRDQKFIRTAETDKSLMRSEYSYKEFYVDPETNLLCRVADEPSNRQTKGMSSDELREFRESEKKSSLKSRKEKRTQQFESEEIAKEVLKEHKT
ncbi:hypothetical protein [Fulvivirga lutimaris]|uniref:hypothetical protein n=1 Tax=Fulvivirga lutimaris TaxID=1819566 RepID=UPI0012BD242C|nr:hypothetical protein [Fulvivirga lutimaris]MTI38189.1 hypothetical protein [Fulvivirga lutimaris]